MSGFIYLEPRDNPDYLFRQLIHDINTNFSAGTSNSGGGSPIQNGLNTYTGGTQTAQTINISALTIDNIYVSGNSLFDSISATTYYSGSTSLQSIIDSISSGSTSGAYLPLSGGTVTGDAYFTTNLFAENLGIGLTGGTPSFKFEAVDYTSGPGWLGRYSKPNMADGDWAGLLFGAGPFREGFIQYFDNQITPANRHYSFGIGGDPAGGVSIFQGGRLIVNNASSDPVDDGTGNNLQINGASSLNGSVFIGTSGSPVTLTYHDGNEASDKILASDSNGLASWKNIKNINGFNDSLFTGFTYSSNTFTLIDNTGGTLSVGLNSVTGLTVNGDLNVTGYTSVGTISAATYENLPTDVFVTGGTFNNTSNTATFTNNTGGTFDVNITPPVSPATNLFLYYNFS